MLSVKDTQELEWGFGEILVQSKLPAPHVVVGKRFTLTYRAGGYSHLIMGIVTGVEYTRGEVGEELQLFTSVNSLRIGDAFLEGSILFTDNHWYIRVAGYSKPLLCNFEVSDT
jgi:hypothetical protein